MWEIGTDLLDWLQALDPEKWVLYGLASAVAAATVVGVPAHEGRPERSGSTTNGLAHGDLPDPLLQVLGQLHQRQRQLEARINQLEAELATARRDQLPSAHVMCACG